MNSLVYSNTFKFIICECLNFIEEHVRTLDTPHPAPEILTNVENRGGTTAGRNPRGEKT